MSQFCPRLMLSVKPDFYNTDTWFHPFGVLVMEAQLWAKLLVSIVPL